MSIVDRPLPVLPTSSLSPAAAPPAAFPQPGPITLAMYDRMIAAGVFDPAEPQSLELIGGGLHVMSPIGDRHAGAVGFLTRWSSQHADPARLLVCVQSPLAIPGSGRAPQPDIAWVALRRYADRRPLPEEVSLLIEVADTSLEFKTTLKAGLSPAEFFLPGRRPTAHAVRRSFQKSPVSLDRVAGMRRPRQPAEAGKAKMSRRLVVRLTASQGCDALGSRRRPARRK